MVPPRLDQINLVVRDIANTRRFYARLGLEFGEPVDLAWAPHHVSAPAGRHGAVDVDLDSTTFAPLWNEGWPGGPGAVLGFRVDHRQDVDEMVATLAADGAAVQQAPYDAFWGARYAVVSDPDGNPVGIMSPAEEAYRSPPPPPP